MTEQPKKAGKRLFRLINGETIFGEVEIVPGVNGEEVIIKKPFTIIGSQPIPYMGDLLPNAPAAIQIHPMNVLWSVPLDEFKEIRDFYIKETTGLIV